MNIVVILKNGFVNEVIVPDAFVTVVVIDQDDAQGAPTATVEGEPASLDSTAIVKHTVDADRIQTMLGQYKADLVNLDDGQLVRKVRELLEKATPYIA